jgi:hypothetical protein
MKLKLIEIRNIQNALEVLDKQSLPIVYELAKNLKTCSKITDEATQLELDIFNRLADKEDGKLKLYPSPQGDTVKISDPDKLKEYTDHVQKVNNEEHDITFVSISPRKLEKASGIPAAILIPLIDIIVKE